VAVALDIRNSQYSAEQITNGLTAVALCGGNCVQAAEQLKAAGTPIPENTLYDWRNHRHAERYREISNELAPKIEAHVVDLQRELATRAARAALLAVDLEHKRIALGEVKDASTSARNLATVSGIAVDKIMSLTGRPTSIIEHRNADQILRELQAFGYVDGTAEDVPEAETPQTQAA
jgi:hypothetical protein